MSTAIYTIFFFFSFPPSFDQIENCTNPSKLQTSVCEHLCKASFMDYQGNLFPTQHKKCMTSISTSSDMIIPTNKPFHNIRQIKHTPISISLLQPG